MISDSMSRSGGFRQGLLNLLRRRFFLLFLFLLGSIVVYPYAETAGFGYYSFRVLMGAVIVMTVYAVTFRRGLLVPSILQHTFIHPHDVGWIPLVSRLISLAFYLVVIYIIFRHVFENENPDSEAILGALCVYLLVGFAFSSTYMVIAGLQPHAFYLSASGNLHSLPDRFDLLYFSFGTLTELGAPGIIAASPFTRSVSLLESIIGILYLAILILRLNHTVLEGAKRER
jgi:hypothetical protein